MSHPNTPWLLFDFSDPGAVAEWDSINDRVMGGVSSSRLRHDLVGHTIFEGNVSLERNGGFASIRSTPADRGRPGAQTCFIEARTTGNRFKLNLLTDDAFDSISYQASFAPSATWQTLHTPVSTFRATFRGREVPGALALDPARIRRVGLMIAERQAGAFALEVRRIGLARAARSAATRRQRRATQAHIPQTNTRRRRPPPGDRAPARRPAPAPSSVSA